VRQGIIFGKSRRPVSLAGAGLLPFPAVLILLGLPGCGLVSHGEPDPQVEEARALGLPEGARLHRVTLGGRGATEHAVPPLIQARPGDGVEFLTEDHRVHTVTFPADSLEPEVHAFLEASGQLGSPPLVSRGTRFVLQLRDAPTGRYPFVSEGHGGTAHGVLLVEPPPRTRRRGRD
jgi:plastocyanin